MKKMIFIFIIALSSYTSADWIEYATRENGDIYFFDNARVEKSTDHIKVWNRIRYKTSIMAASSYQSLLNIDCANQTETTLQNTFYTDKDWKKPAMATNMKEQSKKNFSENSSTAQLCKILCSK